jgi:hypothetical protein
MIMIMMIIIIITTVLKIKNLRVRFNREKVEFRGTGGE